MQARRQRSVTVPRAGRGRDTERARAQLRDALKPQQQHSRRSDGRNYPANHTGAQGSRGGRMERTKKKTGEAIKATPLRRWRAVGHRRSKDRSGSTLRHTALHPTASQPSVSPSITTSHTSTSRLHTITHLTHFLVKNTTTTNTHRCGKHTHTHMYTHAAAGRHRATQHTRPLTRTDTHTHTHIAPCASLRPAGTHTTPHAVRHAPHAPLFTHAHITPFR